ncbi:hypothetical protein ACLOJK_012895 [Asimina triloba]
MHYSTFFAVLSVVVAVSLVLAIYQYFGCNQGRRATNRPRRQWFESTEEEPTSTTTTTTISFENSIKHLMPAYKYGDKEGLVGKGDGTCAVCLTEFMDGESLRQMPECMHSFHVPCIDMWLKSHPNCPLCRTNMTPTPSPGCVP